MDTWTAIIVNIFVVVAIIILIIAAIIGAFLRQKHRARRALSDQNWYLQISLSRKDALSQWFLVLGSLALANAVYAINNNFGEVLSWRLILLISVLIFGLIAYFGRSVYCAAIGIVGVLIWWTAQTSFWQTKNNIGYSAVIAMPVGLMWLAILLYAVGFWQMRKMAWKRFGVTYAIIGLIVMNLLLFSFSTESGLRFLEEMTTPGGIFDVWQNLVALLVVASLSGAAIVYGWIGKALIKWEAFFATVLFFIFQLLTVLPNQSLLIDNHYTSQLTAAGLFWAAIFNFVLLSEILGAIFAGYLRREIWMINFGTVLLIIFTAVKYFDWFFKFMDKSVFFIVAGIMLFAIGWAMERGRRYLAQTIQPPITDNQENQ